MKLFEHLSARGKVLPYDRFRLFLDLPDECSTAHLSALQREELVNAGQAALERDYPALPASLYRQFVLVGNRSDYETCYFDRRGMLADLVRAELAEQKGRFLTKIIDGVWALLEETTWVLPAHNIHTGGGQLCGDYGERVGYIDLFSAETGAMLAWIYHCLGDAIEREVPKVVTGRMLYEISRRVLTPYRTIDMHWMGFHTDKPINNWNPWIFSNILFASALCERELSAREGDVERAMKGLDNYLKGYREDGGCDEGPSYWGVACAAFFDCLELLYDLTGGSVDLFRAPGVKEMGEYILKFHISGDYFINFADCPCRLLPDAFLMTRFGRRTGSEDLQSFGLSRLPEHPDFGRQTLYRAHKNFCEYAGGLTRRDGYRDPETAVIESIGVAAMRQGEFFAAIKGGCNGESHNHNDVGSFVVYHKGEPLIIDAGVDTYSASTFNDKRYTLWYMQSSYHNLPDLNGYSQYPGAQYRAEDFSVDPATRTVTLRLERAYPEEAGVQAFYRRLQLSDGGVEISDSWVLDGEGRVEQHLLFKSKPLYTKPGQLILPGGMEVSFDPIWQVQVEEIDLTRQIDQSQECIKPCQSRYATRKSLLQNNWGQKSLYRVTLSGTGLHDVQMTVTIREI